MAEDQDREISEAFGREEVRLRNFIRRRVADRFDAEDILQDVFAELVQAYRLAIPIRQVGAWLFRVARNRITDLFRRSGREILQPPGRRDDGGETASLLDLLPSPDAGPEAAYARTVLLEELEEALDELPPEQREVFLAHEVEGRSFKELAEQTGVGLNTLLSRKHYAVRHLRRRLQSIYSDFEKGGLS